MKTLKFKRLLLSKIILFPSNSIYGRDPCGFELGFGDARIVIVTVVEKLLRRFALIN